MSINNRVSKAMYSLKPTQFDYHSVCFSDSSDSGTMFFDEDKEEIKPYFNIDDAMQDAYRKNSNKILAESIRLIAPGIYTNYNSLNILVGNQGKGKTHTMLRDIIQISRLKDTNVHLIVYISKNGSINDSTFEAQQE